MKHYITSILILIFMLLSATSHAQQIELKNRRYYVEGEKMNPSEVMALMKPYPESYDMMRSGISTSYLSLPVTLGGCTMLMVGWIESIDMFGAESKANYTLMGVGAGLTIVGFIMAASAGSQRRRAVELYNSSVNKDTFQSSRTTWQLEATGTGLKMKVNF